ncbi:MAG: TetR/AcrR family transcriptional regulator, partial [Candidatus Dadabacteria bacterium]
MSGPRKRLPRDDRRRQIVAAAIGVFGKHGYHAATTAELARAAGVSEALLYQHFDSKKDLLLAAIAQIGEWVHEGLQEVLAATRDPKVTLLQLSDAFREFTRSHPDVPRLALALT